MKLRDLEKMDWSLRPCPWGIPDFSDSRNANIRVDRDAHSGTPAAPLPIDVFDPLDRFGVTDLSQIALGGRKTGVA